VVFSGQSMSMIFNNMLYVRYVHLTKAKYIHKRQTHHFVEWVLHADFDSKGSVEKKKTLVVSFKVLGAKTN
jgi:hypothetical protein